jgi:hypothetical protein
MIEHFLGSYAEIGKAAVSLHPFFRSCSLFTALEIAAATSCSEREAQHFHISTVMGAR